jgi:mannosyltransferase OCH1-like enzyme
MIPRTLHQVWIGPDALPKEFEKYRESWRRHHPEWELRFWTEANLPTTFRRREAYERDRIPAERSDIIRLEVLWLYGGVYIDTDMECRRPIDGLLEGVDLFVVYLKPGRITNTVIGSEPGHPLLDQALRELKPQQLGGSFDKSASGPHFLDSLVKDYPTVAILPSEQFYPSTPEQRKDAFAIHHSARSWKDREAWRQTALLAEKRLEKARRDLQEERRAHEKTRKAFEDLKREIAVLKEIISEAGTRTLDKADSDAKRDKGLPARRRRLSLSFLRSRT